MIAQSPPNSASSTSRQVRCRDCGFESPVRQLFQDRVCLACRSNFESLSKGRGVDQSSGPAARAVAPMGSKTVAARRATTRSTTASAGSRWLLKRVGRIALWLVIATVFLAGVKAIITPNRVAVRGAASSASQNLPMAAVDAVAVRFSLAYFTYDPTRPDQRAQSLSAFLPAGADMTVGWNGQGSEQALTAVVAGSQQLDDNRALVTVATEVTGGRWLYTQVPLTAQDGNVTVTGPPAAIPPPGPGSAAPGQAPALDAELTGQLQSPLAAFFSAYAGSGDLAYYAAPGVHLSGLGGGLKFTQLESAAVYVGTGNTRAATATVEWTDPVTDASMVQAYHLQLIAVAGRWYVASVSAAG